MTITTDRLTLDGAGSAVLNGGGPTEFEGVVTLDGAQGVTLMGFTIRNGPGTATNLAPSLGRPQTRERPAQTSYNGS